MPVSAAQSGSSYKIQRGDTLWAIASRLQSKGVKGSIPEIIHRIAKLNHIQNVNLIHTGNTLKLPGKSGAPADSDFKPAPKKPKHIPSPDAPSAPNGKSGTKYNVPHISQYSPKGKDSHYWNGPANCGPTSMAQIARAFGYGKGMTDAQLINHLGKIGGTGSSGTGLNGIAKMAHAMGKKATTRGPGAQIDWMVEQLKAGKLVVANGDYHAMPPHQNGAKTSGHYVTVAGLDAHGNFIVRDPADGRVNIITRAQMKHFINSNPNGGWQVAIG